MQQFKIVVYGTCKNKNKNRQTDTSLGAADCVRCERLYVRRFQKRLVVQSSYRCQYKNLEESNTSHGVVLKVLAAQKNWVRRSCII